jgi:hypothetical protein
MPINSILIESIKASVIRNEIKKLVVNTKTNFMLFDNRVYETTDGIHLDSLEAQKYTSFFKSQLISK